MIVIEGKPESSSPSFWSNAQRILCFALSASVRAKLSILRELEKTKEGREIVCDLSPREVTIELNRICPSSSFSRVEIGNSKNQN